MHILFNEGYADRAYMARYTDDPAGLEAHLATRDPAWAAAVTGLLEDEIVVLHAQSFAGMQKRVVIVEGLWPNHAFEEGVGINLLTSADPGLPRGGAVFHDTSVWLRPA